MSSVPQVFPNYMQLRSRVPIPVWHALRVISVGTVLGLCVILVMRPAIGLLLWWGLIVPSLPLLFFVAPGLWRNVCPLAALNQTPRLLGFTRGRTLPKWLKEYSYVFGIALFFVIVPTRKVLFNGSGLATALLILGVLVAAFTGGVLFKGKSGWCSTFCPMLPVQRIYGQTPLVLVPNRHCQPCVGCSKNCYDFNPAVAYLADLYEEDRYYSGYRKFFAGAFPGLILAFFTVPNPPAIPIAQMYLQFALYMLLSVGVFHALDSFVKVTTNKLTGVFAAGALNLFYWFAAPVFLASLGQLFGFMLPIGTVWVLRLIVFVLSAVWIGRTYTKEALFVLQAATARALRVASPGALRQRQAAQQGQPELTILPQNKRIVAEAGRTLLELIESNDLPIEAGCRMGVCGADPVAITAGMEHLSPVGGDERATLDRLGFAATTRMACCARVQGSCSVALKPERRVAAAPATVAAGTYDPAISRVVIIGNGIAGVTAADHIRRRHPTCEIHLVGREKHYLYNRMAISRLIYGRSAMQGLYLMPESWYDEHQITCWVNTPAMQIDREKREVVLGPGERLSYDRLLLTTGSSSYVPSIEGFGLGGTFALREADDAMQLRAYAQKHTCRRAVVAGGGLLGLEAAYALHKLGVHTVVLERSERLLTRQLDARGSELLRAYLERLGLEIVTNAETAALLGDANLQQLIHDTPDLKDFLYNNGQVAEVLLKDGRKLPCDLFLVCAGVRPNLELAHQAALQVNRGIVVDEGMRTSAPEIFAAGDVAEYQGQMYGLWPVAVDQAQIAAINAIGGKEVYKESVPVTILKVVGVELTSIGKFEPASPGDVVIALEDAEAQRYRKLVITDGKIVGAILLGHPLDAPAVTAAIKQELDVTPYLTSLEAGDWSVLARHEQAPTAVSGYPRVGVQ